LRLMSAPTAASPILWRVAHGQSATDTRRGFASRYGELNVYIESSVISDRDDPSFDTHFECFAKHEFIRGVSYIQFDRLCSTDSSHSNRDPEFYFLAIASSFAIKYVPVS
jgi:hypothetical protein